MSFPRAPIKRFNEIAGSTSPAVGSYDPKFLTDVGVSAQKGVIFDKGGRVPLFRKQDGGINTPPLPEPEVAENYIRGSSYRRSLSPAANLSRKTSSTSVPARPSRCSSYTSILGRHSRLGNSNPSGPNSSTFSASQRASETLFRTTMNDERVQFNKEREAWLEKEHDLQVQIEDLRAQLILYENIKVECEDKHFQTEKDKSESENELEVSLTQNAELLNTKAEQEAINLSLQDALRNLETEKIALDQRISDLSTANQHLKEGSEQLESQLEILKEATLELGDVNSKLDTKLFDIENEALALKSRFDQAENKLLTLQNEKDDWLKKEVGYQKTINKLEKTVEENKSQLEESDERVKVLVMELETHYQVGKEKVAELESIRSRWDSAETTYIKGIEDLKKQLAIKDSAIQEAREKMSNVTEERDKYSVIVHELEFNVAASRKTWDETERYYKETVFELNAKCHDLETSAMLYKKKLMSMHNTWKNILPIKQQLLEFKTELNNLLAGKAQNSDATSSESCRFESLSQNQNQVCESTSKNTSLEQTKPSLVDVVTEIEKENITLRESISFMQGAIADILSTDSMHPKHEPVDKNGNYALPAPVTQDCRKSSKNDIQEMLEGSNAIKKSLEESIKKRVSRLGLNLILDEDETELQAYESSDSGDTAKSLG